MTGGIVSGVVGMVFSCMKRDCDLSSNVRYVVIIVAQVNGYIEEMRNSTVADESVSNDVVEEEDDDLLLYILVCGSEIYVGNEWWFVIVYEFNMGKSKKTREI